MNIRNIILFIIPSIIWGSTWLAITFQLGKVDPIVSVAYRFYGAGLILFLYCLISSKPLKYSFKDHIFMALQGVCLFGVNYWMVYMAEQFITSGLVAVFFSLIIFCNIIFGRIILKNKLQTMVILGGILGFTGTVIIFWNDIMTFSLESNRSWALVFCLISLVLASMGNIISALNQRNRLPVIQTNAFGMLYGALIISIIAIFLNTTWTFDKHFNYISSLIYLAFFGSVIAFSAYLQLLGNIGPEKSAYTIVIIPIIAMILSSIFEGYRWNPYAWYGMFFLLAGMILALGNIKINVVKLWKS